MLTYLIILQLMSVCLGAPGEASIESNDCKTQDSSRYASLNDVCQKCKEQYGEGIFDTNCKKNCFDNYFFDGCIESLGLQHRKEELLSDRKYLNNNVYEIAPVNCKNYVPQDYRWLAIVCYECQGTTYRVDRKGRQDQEIYGICVSNCFHNEFFDGCIETPEKESQKERLKDIRDKLNGGARA